MLRRLPPCPELFHQARHVAGYGMQGWRPAERARPRAADTLIQRERIGVRTHLRPCFRKWNVADVRTHADMSRNGIDDVDDALVRLVIGVEYAERLGPRSHAEVNVREVANIYAGPGVLPFADDANQSVCGIFR